MNAEGQLDSMRLMTRHSPRAVMTSQWVSDLEIAARELSALRRALHPQLGDGLCERLMGYASAIEATLRSAGDD